MARLKLTPAEVLIIKRRIWNGDTRKAIQADFPQVSLGEICNIGAGHKWADIPWPDKSYGALPDSRKLKIAKARRRVKEKVGELTRRELQAG